MVIKANAQTVGLYRRSTVCLKGRRELNFIDVLRRFL